MYLHYMYNHDILHDEGYKVSSIFIHYKIIDESEEEQNGSFLQKSWTQIK